MSIMKMTRKQLVPIATHLLSEANKRHAEGYKCDTLQGDPLAAQCTFGWLDHIDEYCARYGREHRAPMMAMIRRGMIEFANAWAISHPAMTDDLAAWHQANSERLARERSEAYERQARLVSRAVHLCRENKITTRAALQAMLASTDFDPTHLPAQVKAWIPPEYHDLIMAQFD